MLDGKMLSKMIREKKKREGQADLRQDMDYAGQNAIDPNAAWDAKQAGEVNEVLDNPDHERPSDSEMGENESSQSEEDRKRISARLAKYLESL
jgi:hypothetical protein